MNELAENHTISRLEEALRPARAARKRGQNGIVTGTNAVDVPVASAMVALGIAVAADPHRSLT